MTYRKTMLSTSILGVLMLSGAAFAADQPAVPAAQDGTQAQSAPAAAADETRTRRGDATNLQTITVQGIVGSQMRSQQLKRYASNIQDSISAENIGELPDVTITDSLQRITGVQIDRSAGEGAGLNVRGLSQVQTQLNGEAFLPATNIVGTQPDFSGIPAQLFNGVDVIKSPTASTLHGGLSGTINLRTRRPWDMDKGWTFAGSLAGSHGVDVGKTEPKGNVLVSYNDDGKWGFLLSAAHSKITHENSSFLGDQYGGALWDETGGAYGSTQGVGHYGSVLAAFSGAGLPLPGFFTQDASGGVDLNNDGKHDGAFYATHMFSPNEDRVKREDTGINASFQVDLGSGFTATADAFYTHQDQNERQVIAELMPSGWMAQSKGFTKTTPTGAMIDNSAGGQSEIYTVQGVRYWPGDIAAATNNSATRSTSRNYNLELKYDDGGFFAGELRAISANATQTRDAISLEMVQSNGWAWQDANHQFNTPDGLREFHPDGYPQYSSPMDIDFSGGWPSISLSPELTTRLNDPKSSVFKGLNSVDGFDREANMNLARFDGHLRFDNGNSVDFGVRNSIRTANNTGYFLGSKVYGCNVMYHAFDIKLNDPACSAGDANGPYSASGEYSGLRYDQLPDRIKNNWKYYGDLAGTGMGLWSLDPKAMDDPAAFMSAMYPDTFRNINPQQTWDVKLHDFTGYLQANFATDLGPVPVDGNVGVRVERTKLHVTQNTLGQAQPYGLYAASAGQVYTDRTFTDVLPAANIAFHLTPDFVTRLSWSQNTTPLNLDQWGGGLGYSYALQTLPDGSTVQAVASGSQAGSPDLDSWASTNAGLSLEYYMSDKSMFNLAYFNIRVASFIETTSITRCDVPDLDGVVRRCIPFTTPIQGKGVTLSGWEFNWNQALGDWNAPGFLANTGFSANWTYSPSNTGRKDLAGNPVPFGNNSKYAGNLVLWYQGDRLQVRLAGNYRSEQATQSNYGGIQGLQQYVDSQTFVDASVAYKINDNFSAFLKGSNLTGEKQRFYLTWKDQFAHAIKFEKRYEVGVNVTF
jgi:TonB-dependent receptor